MKRPYEKAIIVRYDIFASASNPGKESDKALVELNALLAEGWLIKHAYGMGGTQSQVACSLVILEQ